MKVIVREEKTELPYASDLLVGTFFMTTTGGAAVMYVGYDHMCECRRYINMDSGYIADKSWSPKDRVRVLTTKDLLIVEDSEGENR